MMSSPNQFSCIKCPNNIVVHRNAPVRTDNLVHILRWPPLTTAIYCSAGLQEIAVKNKKSIIKLNVAHFLLLCHTSWYLVLMMKLKEKSSFLIYIKHNIFLALSQENIPCFCFAFIKNFEISKLIVTKGRMTTVSPFLLISEL